MGRTNSVDKEVYDTIERLMQSAGDCTLNDALRRLLNMPPTQRRNQARTNEAVLAALRSHPCVAAAELSQIAGLGYSTTMNVLVALEKAGHALRKPDRMQWRRGAPTYLLVGHRPTSARRVSYRLIPDLTVPTLLRLNRSEFDGGCCATTDALLQHGDGHGEVLVTA
jgi:hypothetical protein